MQWWNPCLWNLMLKLQKMGIYQTSSRAIIIYCMLEQAPEMSGYR